MRFSAYRTLSIAAAVCLVAAVATADDPHFYVGFTGIQTTTVSGGVIRYVDLQIGSNESTSAAAAYTIFSTLVVKRANGADVCNSSLEFNSKVRPAVRPLRFEVFYPTAGLNEFNKRRSLLNTKYTLFGKIEVRRPGTNLLEKEQNQYTVEFPSGGTPSCKHLMSGQTG